MDGTIVPEPVDPTYDWYVDKSSPYTLGSVSDLYGLAHIVNGTASSIARDTFADKVVNLGVDIDLSDKVWTPIGESARKQNVEKTFAELGASGGNRPQANETEEEYIARLNALPKTLTKYVYLGNYFFAEKTNENIYKYWQSDQALDANKFFAGTFDGQNHKITGLSDIGYTPRTAIIYANSSKVLQGYTFGLFGVVEQNVTIKNLVLEEVTINGAYYNSGNSELVTADLDSVGAVVGYSWGIGNVTIDNIRVMSGTISAFAAVGGILGRSYTQGEVIIKNSENRANLTMDEYHAGGMIAYISKATKVTFINNTNYGNITAKVIGNYAGAMIHSLPKGGNFIDCRNFGNIIGTNHTGLGMVGKGDTDFNFTNCVNYGALTPK